MTDGPCTHDTYVHSYDEMRTLSVHQITAGQVSCNTCNMVHAFYECPSQPGMDKEAQKVYFHAKALEKRNSKHHQCINQIFAEYECSNGEEYNEDAPAARSMDTTDWTNEDWIDSNQEHLSWIFGKANTIQ
jgi:hypothetical protein